MKAIIFIKNFVKYNIKESNDFAKIIETHI